MFADMFHIAETFREKYPEDFQVLATVPATLDTIHYKRSVCCCVRMRDVRRYCCGFERYCCRFKWYCYCVKMVLLLC